MNIQKTIKKQKGMNKMYEKIKFMIEELINDTKKEFYGIRGAVDNIIENNEKDVNKIEHLLEELLDESMHLSEAEDYFFQLCDYLKTIDKKVANDYLELYKEMNDDDYRALSYLKCEKEEFEKIRHIDEYDEEFWYARELMKFLGHSDWNKFKKIIQKSKLTYGTFNSDSYSHFYKIKTKKDDNSNINQENYQLSRIACYLIILNCKSTKTIVLRLKSYIALTLMKAENKI